MPILKLPTTLILLACSSEGSIWLPSAYVVKLKSVSADFFHLLRIVELEEHLSMSVLPSVVVILFGVTMGFATG
jgi:hypothetical protein